MVNCFKGAVAELLATKTCMRLMKQLQRNGQLQSDARLYIGDSVGIHSPRGKGTLKGGDQHILIKDGSLRDDGLVVAGVPH